MATASCSICDRPVGRTPREVRWPRVVVCARCYGRPVHIRTSADCGRRGVHTFYLDSLSVEPAGRPDDTGYVVKRFRQRMTCTCPDFTHRGQVLGVPCKHVRLVTLFAHSLRGWRHVPRDADIRFRLSSGRQ
jgi:hypothetical protein